VCESKLSRALRPKLRYAVNTRGIELDRIVSDTRTIAEIRFAANILHKKTSKILGLSAKLFFPCVKTPEMSALKLCQAFSLCEKTSLPYVVLYQSTISGTTLLKSRNTKL